MKKVFISVIIAALVLLALFVGAYFMSGHPGLTKAYYLEGNNGAHFMIIEGGPIVMHTDDESAFDGLSSGDRILVLHGGVRESYPGSTDITAVFRLGGGSLEDIPENIISSLAELGWLD